LAVSCRERVGRRVQKSNELAREVVNWNARLCEKSEGWGDNPEKAVCFAAANAQIGERNVQQTKSPVQWVGQNISTV
jgi:hypothetical protein